MGSRSPRVGIDQSPFLLEELGRVAVVATPADEETYGVADDEDHEVEEVFQDDETSEAGGVVTFPSGESLRIVTGLPTGRDEEYWDPTPRTRTGSPPVLDTGPEERRKRLSASFTVAELARSGRQRFDHARIDPELVRCLQALRAHVGKPVTITSGFRSWKYNRHLYLLRKDAQGNPQKPIRSQHCAGRAADVVIQGMTGLDIGRAAIAAYKADIGVGIGRTYAHIDVRGRAAVWNYQSAGDPELNEWVKEIAQLQRSATRGAKE